MSVDEVDHGRRCVRAGDVSSRTSHLGQPAWLIKQSANGGDHAVTVQLAVWHEHSRTSVNQRSSVRGLMVSWCTRERHENRRYAGDGQLGNRRCAGSAQHEIGGCVHTRHVVFVRDELVREESIGRKRDALEHLGVITSAGHVPDGEISSSTPLADRIGDRIVDPTSAQRSAKDGEHRSISRKAEPGTGGLPISVAGGGERDDFGTDRIAGPCGPRKVGPVERNRTRLGESSSQSIRKAGNGILLRDDDRDAPQHGTDHTRHRGVATQPDNDGGAKPSDKTDSGEHGGHQPEDRSKIGQRQPPLNAATRQHRERKPGVGDQPRLDAS